MKVKNRVYIIKIANKILNNNRGRKNILLISIILTCILFTSLFSVVSGIFKSMEFQTMRTIGSISHGSFKQLSQKDIDILSKDPDIKEYAIVTKIGNLDNNKINAEISYIDKKGLDWSLMDHKKGEFPINKNEVYIDINTARKLGYKGNIGEKIKIPFYIEKSYTGEKLEEKEDEFVISGTFESPIDSNVGVGQIYVSNAYLNNLKLPDKQNDMDIMLKNSWKIKDKLLKIASNNGYRVVEDPSELADKDIRIGVNFAYLSNSDDFDYSIFLPSIFFLFLVFLSGFLIINNIFKISINEDIKLFGLLKTIGMTKVQIKKLVHMESLIVSIPSIVFGNILGILIGKLILNKVFDINIMLENINLSAKNILVIIIFSVIFTLLTVFLSVMAPARQASKISPIDASRFNEYNSKKRYNSKTISLKKLGIRQVFSNKFRFISIIISMSLSAVILNSVLTYTTNIDLEKVLSDNIVTDYNLASPKYFRYMYNTTEDKLDKNYIKKLIKEKGFINGGAIYSYGSLDNSELKIDGENALPVLFGIDDYLITKQKFIEGSFNKYSWKSKDFAIIAENSDEKSNYKVGDKIRINSKFGTKDLKIMGKINYNFSNGLRYTLVVRERENDENSPILRQEYIYVSPSMYEKLTGDSSIMSYGFDVRNSSKENFNKKLKNLEKEPDFSFDSRDLQIKSFEDYKNLIEFVGYSLSFILFLISILNFINIIATDIIKNKINLSILESMGMTRKNIKKYLVYKNLIYSLASLIFSIIIMILVAEFILKDFMESNPWTSFRFIICPLLIVNIINIIIGILFTSIFYESRNKNSLVDRIRNIE